MTDRLFWRTIRSMRKTIFSLLASGSLLLACSTANNSHGDPVELPEAWKGTWYEQPGPAPLGCKMFIGPDGHGVFAGPLGAPERTNLNGAFSAKGDQLYFKGDSIELAFERQADSSLAYTGEIPTLGGLVLLHRR